MPDATILLKIAAISEGVPLSQLNLRIFAGGRELGTEVALPVDWQKVAISCPYRGIRDCERGRPITLSRRLRPSYAKKFALQDHTALPSAAVNHSSDDAASSIASENNHVLPAIDDALRSILAETTRPSDRPLYH
jgi:hypothetical protein